MFRRNMLGVLDPFPPFLSTPFLTQLSLQNGICYTGADPRCGPLFGRMAEQSPPHKRHTGVVVNGNDNDNAHLFPCSESADLPSGQGCVGLGLLG